MEIIVTSGELEDGRVTNTTEIIYTEDAIRSRKWHSIVRMKDGWHFFCLRWL